MIVWKPLVWLVSIGTALCGCAPFADIEPGKLTAAACAKDTLRKLSDTRRVEIYAARHYRETNPVIGYEYGERTGRTRFTWFEITGDGPSDYLYVHPGNAESRVDLPGEAANAVTAQCHIKEGQMSVT